MFRKIVSNLSFSPALVGQLGFYARRLKKEETTRRLGLVFTALALVVQSFAVFTPPEAANAASSADFVSGGVSTIGEYLRRYDNDGWIRGVYTSLGITRANISNAKLQTICEDGKYNWSRTSLYSTAQGQRSWSFKTGSGNNATAYYRPMELTQGGPCHQAFVGHSDVFGWFAVKKDCGNLITKVPPHAPNPKAVCQSLNVKAITMKRFRVTAKSSTEDGASIKKYKYEIKRGGEIVAKRGFDSSRTTHEWVYEQATPGTYHAQVYVVTSEGEKTNRDCKDVFVVDEKPVAICTDLAVNVTNRTIVSLRGKAKAENGAKIKRYVFVVSKDGKEVKRVVVKTSKERAAAESFALKQAGDYRVRLTVVTSIGDRTGPECVKSLTVAKKEVCAYNPSLPANSPECQPCPDNPEIWIKDEDCDAELINTKSVTNMTQGNVDATTKVARASDKLTYTITVQNRGFASESVVFSENLEDVLEYATLVDRGGASFNEDSKTLTWPAVRLAAGETQSRTLAVQIMSDIPSTNTGTSNEDSYDCRMVNTFGNSVDVDVECATQKVVVEQVVSELPETGPRENMMFAAALLAIVTYFYARSRQLGKEVRLIRRNLNTGTV